MYDVEIVSSVTRIPKAVWDDLAPPDDPLWRWSYFRVMETSGVGPDGFEYLIFRRGARIVAILPAFWFGAYPLALGDAGKLEAVIGRVRKTIPGFLCLSVYFCGHPMGEGRLLRRDGEAIRFDSSLLHQVRQIAWRKGLRWIIFKDFDSAVPTLFPTLRSSTFFAVEGLPDARLYLSTTNFEDFIAASKGNARKNIRKRLRKFAGMTNLRVEVLNSGSGRPLSILHHGQGTAVHGQLRRLAGEVLAEITGALPSLRARAAPQIGSPARHAAGAGTWKSALLSGLRRS